jgi:hypothetical protein
VRRRRLAAAPGPLPPALACRFTTGEMATLRIVADEVRSKGRCDRTLDEIAARAGVSRSTARNAMRSAARLGLVRVTARPQPGRKNLPNVIEIVSTEWRIWINRGPKPIKPITDRVQKVDRHGYEDRKGAFQVEGARAMPSRNPGSPLPEAMTRIGRCRSGRPM